MLTCLLSIFIYYIYLQSLQDPRTRASHSKPVHPLRSGVKATAVWEVLPYALLTPNTILFPPYSADCTVEAELDVDMI